MYMELGSSPIYVLKLSIISVALKSSIVRPVYIFNPLASVIYPGHEGHQDYEDIVNCVTWTCS